MLAIVRVLQFRMLEKIRRGFSPQELDDGHG